MKEEKVFFPSGRIRLEGLIRTNEALSARGGVILCHPHPLHGGEMHHPVIDAGVDASLMAGLSSLRFNFRGVGESEGNYADGVGEKGDVRAAIDCLDATFRNRAHPLIVFGYSFGAWTGLPVAVGDSRIDGMVAIAPPLEMYDFSFLKGCPKKKLVIVGSEDPFCPLHLLEKWFEDLDEPKSMTVIEGADHFFFSHHRSLLPPLFEFFKTL